MKTSRVLLILAAILAFDLSLFQSAISSRPKWSAAFGAPPGLVADRELLLAAGVFVSLIVAMCGIYALSGAGLLRRLPFLRSGLLAIGCGFVFLGTSVIPQVLVLSHGLPVSALMRLRLMSASFITVMTGLSYLGGLAFGWKRLSAGRHEAPRGGALQAASLVGQLQSQNQGQG